MAETGRLRQGFTTGACAAAAAKGAAKMLRDQRIIDEVEICLPGGGSARFRLHGQRLTDTGATCFVVKDAGDDPDVTNGAEIHATIDVEFFTPNRILVKGGQGIGTVTKPGLAVSVGEWAINPVPRKMILTGVKEVLAMRCVPATFTIAISIPNGEELARKTLNERLGIIGGLSILGTTGIVKPISASAWLDSMECAIDVAIASGYGMLVLSTGRTSEMVAQQWLGAAEADAGSGKTVPDESFVLMGDHVGHAVRSCLKKGITQVIIAGQFAKLLKIGCGFEQTHVFSSELDLQILEQWLQSAGIGSIVQGPLSRFNTARQLLAESGNAPELVKLVCNRARDAAENMAPGLNVRVLLAGYQGEVLYFA